MDGFDVHAFGWILTRCTLWEALRIQIGLSPEVDQTGYDRIAELWGNVHAGMILDRAADQRDAKDRNTRIPDARYLLDPRRQKLGKESKRAMKELFEYLVDLWPRRFTYQALTQRFRNWTVSAVINLALLFFVLPAYQLEQPFRGYALVFTLLFGVLSFGFAFQYKRSALLFRHLKVGSDRENSDGESPR